MSDQSALSPLSSCGWTNPPREFTLLPFWFWNDDLQETELLRQMEDFQAHGVHGFVIHPRVGLPRQIGWMSTRMLELMHFVVQAAAQRGMSVVLYDEGMYPSGSSCGQVVAENPAYAVRGLELCVLGPGQSVELAPGETLVAETPNRHGQRIAIIDRPIRSVIRGLHYIGEGPQEETPPAADLLNPAAVSCFVRKVYDRYFESLGQFFGDTIIGIFTDEPHPLGRCQETGVVAGTTDILSHVNRILGYDFTPHLPALWDNGEPHAPHYRAQYQRAIHNRLEETYYAQLSKWCQEHGTQLMGHPAEPGDQDLESYFHIPGQDLVWRWVAPFEPSALEGPESTQAKCSSSAMAHLGRRRNSNECFGAYGHELTYRETCWLVNWALVRGVNMLIPHAFYYSVRGPRRDERPPDVGPNSSWWDKYRGFAAYCSRLCWLNTDSEHICHTAILGQNSQLPWQAARVCYQNQHDFNYLTVKELGRAKVSADGVKIGSMRYQAVVLDGTLDLSPEALPPQTRAALAQLADAGRLISVESAYSWPGAVDTTLQALPQLLHQLCPAAFRVKAPVADLRYRHVRKGGADWLLLFNEAPEVISFTLDFPLPGGALWLNPWDGTCSRCQGSDVTLAPTELRVLWLPGDWSSRQTTGLTRT